MENIKGRIFRAYYRKFGKDASIPSSTIEHCIHEGKEYAILSNVNGILAVYRIMSDETLKDINPAWFESHILSKQE